MKTALAAVCLLVVVGTSGIAQERPAQSDEVSPDAVTLTLSGTTKSTLAVTGGASAPAVHGAVTGDTILRAENQNIHLSANAGAATQFVLTTGGFLGLGTTTPQRLLHLIGPEGKVPSFPSGAMGPRDLLILENNYNANLSFITAGDGYQTTIRFLKSGDNSSMGGLGYVHGANYMYFVAGGAERLHIDGMGSGRIGFSVATPISALHHYSNTADNPTTAAITDAGGKDGLLTLNAGALSVAGGGGGILFGGNGSTQYFAGIKSLLGDSGGNTTGDLAISTRNSTTDTALVERMRVTAVGNVGIGTASPAYKLHVQGDGRFEGAVTAANIAAQYQDVAEWVPATDVMTAGTVVIIDQSTPNTVTASKAAYDTAVAGVISDEPGIILGVRGPNKLRVATTGRVKVRVDARYGAISIGDLLVTSETPGLAMRSEPMTVNGRKFHQPGTLIGKALEPLEKGVGEILVLLSLQ